MSRCAGNDKTAPSATTWRPASETASAATTRFDCLCGKTQDCITELLELSSRIRADGIRTVAIDALPRWSGAARMRRIAEHLGARYHHVDQLRASSIVSAVETFRP